MNMSWLDFMVIFTHYLSGWLIGLDLCVWLYVARALATLWNPPRHIHTGESPSGCQCHQLICKTVWPQNTITKSDKWFSDSIGFCASSTDRESDSSCSCLVGSDHQLAVPTALSGQSVTLVEVSVSHYLPHHTLNFHKGTSPTVYVLCHPLQRFLNLHLNYRGDQTWKWMETQDLIWLKNTDAKHETK